VGVLWCGSLAAQIDIPPGKWWKNDPNLIRALNLAPRQVEQIESIFERYRDRLMDSQLEVRKKTLDLQNLLEAESVEEQRIESQVSALEQARSELARQRLMMVVKIRAQLTSQQWRTLRQVYSQRGLEPPARPRRPGPGFPGRPPRPGGD
jgi:Spy/CpxP family protein refolding chaperone